MVSGLSFAPLGWDGRWLSQNLYFLSPPLSEKTAVPSPEVRGFPAGGGGRRRSSAGVLSPKAPLSAGIEGVGFVCVN